MQSDAILFANANNENGITLVMQDMTLELFLSDEVQTLLDDFAALLDVRVTFFSLSGEWLRRGKEMRNCDYCHLIQNELGFRDQCILMDSDKRKEALESGKDISYCCHAGLHECLAVVRIKGRPAGFVMMGQFRSEGDKMPEFAGLKSTQVRKLKSAFKALPCFSEEKLQAVMGVLRTLIDYITVREFAVIQSDMLRNEINQYIEKHVTEDIRLPEMARKLGRSVSTISQFLRKNYHTSFKNLQLEARLKLAEQYWQEHPDATVAEAAFASGFRDQFYFSRVFSRMRGISPGKYRTSKKR